MSEFIYNNTNYRVYDPDNIKVKNHYFNMFKYQNLNSVNERIKKYYKFNQAKLTIMDAIKYLDDYHDTADPDVDESNYRHAFQSGEFARQLFPDNDWIHLVAFIHDLGKILSSWGEPPHFVSGDTFPVNLPISKYLPYYNEYITNHDESSQIQSSLNDNCGLENLQMCFGHDEYLYQVLKSYKQCTIPKIGLDIIRYHSFYAWHTYRDYSQYESDYDKKLLSFIQEFNKCDLYSKHDDDFKITEQMIDYYTGLIEKYCPGIINW